MTDFMSMWYIQYLVSDTFVIIGTGLKINLRFGVSVNEHIYYNNDI